MMKFLVHIFSVYLLVLILIPCVDVPRDNHLSKAEISQTSSDHHESDTDHCSPFCTCDCCASPVIYNAELLIAGTPLVQSIETVFRNSFITSPSVSIWQPPKVS